MEWVIVFFQFACRMLDINPDIGQMHDMIDQATHAMQSHENKRFLNKEEYIEIGVFEEDCKSWTFCFYGVFQCEWQ